MSVFIIVNKFYHLCSREIGELVVSIDIVLLHCLGDLGTDGRILK
jgi:hypothetical protein